MISNMPEVLKKYQSWVCWKNVIRDGRATKVPFDPKTHQYAKADDPATWATFDQAVAAADVLGNYDYEGVGFELFGTDIAAIDFDGVVDKKGIVDAYALDILRILGNPYSELSPNGKGIHSFIICDALPAGGRKMSQGHTGIEIYHGKEGGRYFACTGHRILGEGVPKITDIHLAYYLITQYKDKKFKSLWLGSAADFGGDESQADFHLMLRLAQFTANDAVKMEKYFSASGLSRRDKWNRQDYRDRTIKAAIESNRSGIAIPPVDLDFKTDALPDKNDEYVIAPAEGEQDGWFPLGDISLVGGASGTGKTTFIFDMLRAQKQGSPVLGHATFKRTFLVLAYDRGKNAFARTMRRLNFMESDIPTIALPLAFGTKAVQNIIDEIEKTDPIPQIIFLEGMDMLLDDTNKKSMVAKFMRELQEVAAHFHIALIGSLGAPKTKRGEGYSAQRDKLSGSEAWGRNCETVMVLEYAEEEDGTAPDRILTVLPRNAKAEKFNLEFEYGKLNLKPTVPEEETATTTNLSKSMRVAVDFLQKVLQDAPKPMKTLIRDAHNLRNISRPTLYAAADYLGVDTQGVEHGTPVWRLESLHAGADESVEEHVSTADMDFGS